MRELKLYQNPDKVLGLKFNIKTKTWEGDISQTKSKTRKSLEWQGIKGFSASLFRIKYSPEYYNERVAGEQESWFVLWFEVKQFRKVILLVDCV